MTLPVNDGSDPRSLNTTKRRNYHDIKQKADRGFFAPNVVAGIIILDRCN
jgi:hypothetical protein